MKRLLIVLVVMLVGFPVIAGIIIGISYYNTSEKTVPTLSVSVMGQELTPIGYEWYAPVLGGLLHRDFTLPVTLETTNAGLLQVSELEVEFPKNYVTTATLSRGNKVLWTGTAEELGKYKFINNGRYLLEMVCDKPEENNLAYGRFTFRITFKVEVEPRIEVSGEAVRQGDVLAIRLYNAQNSAIGEADSGTVFFSPSGDGVLTGYVPVSYRTEKGRYQATIKSGEYSWNVLYEVIDVSYPNTVLEVPPTWQRSALPKNVDLLKSYDDRVPPLFETADENRYWRGDFSVPTPGEMIIEYGARVFIGTAKNYTNSPGITIAAQEGAPVIAPAAGRVVLAEQLSDNGNSIVIEHGGGLKSYFFHLKDLSVAVGNTVQKGSEIGIAGQGAGALDTSLEYEIRLGSTLINPMLLFGGTGGLLFFEKEDEQSGEAKSRQAVVMPSVVPSEDDESQTAPGVDPWETEGGWGDA